ncbi:MAG: hypothetical protein AAGH79_06070 [Bacteroidota bacterium]
MQRIGLLLLALFFLSTTESVFAQSVKSYLKAGDKAFEEQDYNAALFHYQGALAIEPDNVDLQYKYAEVARLFYAYEIAEEYYRKLETSTDVKTFPLLKFRMATVLKNQGYYEDAKDYYRKFINSQTGGKGEFLDQAKAELKTCTWAAKKVKEASELIELEHLEKEVNTPYSEFGPLQMGDTLYYTSFRYEDKNDKSDPPKRLSKVLYSLNASKGKTMRRKFNEEGKLTAHMTLNRDQNRLYYTICTYKESGGIHCKLFYREKDKRGRWAITAKALPAEINSEKYTNTHPSIGYDSIRQKELLYFVSDRENGKGGLDIWFCEMDGKKFGKPQNLESINTEKDDITPFYHTATQTLYFSSEGYQNMGGHDIYSALQDSLTFAEPEHLPFPINGSYNDVYYTLAPDAKTAHFSSNRIGSFYLDKANKACCNDIYKVRYLELPPEPDPVVINPPVTTVVTPMPPKEPTSLEEFLPLTLYFDNDEPDRRTRKTTTKKDYQETYERYYGRKYEYISEYVSPLEDEDQVTEAEEFVEDFFEDEVKKGFNRLNRFSDILLVALKEGQTVEIFLRGFTSPRAQSNYNLALSKRRISCLRNHFESYQKGIFAEYIKSGQLVISESPFGETTASTAISDELEDLRNSVYSPSAAVERRVEIVEIKRN